MFRKVSALIAIATLGLTMSCGGGGGASTPPPPPPPTVSLSASTLNFGNQTTNTTSASQSVTVTNGGGSALSISAISASKDYAVASSGTTCSTTASVAAGANCTISVTFTPTVTGADNGTLSLTDNAAGSPQSVTLTGTGVAPAVAVTGTAFKGAVKGATVKIVIVNSDGTDGAALSSGTDMTDANGNFNVTLTSPPTGPVRVKISGGSFSSEWDGSTKTSSSTISAMLDNVGSSATGVIVTGASWVDDVSSGATGVIVTAASTFVDSLASGILAGKVTGVTSTSITDAHSKAQATVGGFYSIPAGTPIEGVPPSFNATDITANPTNFKVGLVVGTLTAEGAALNPSDPDALVTALASDISDGVWDGKDPGSSIPLGSGTLPSTAGTSDFLSNLGSYLNTGTTPTTNHFTTGTPGLSTVVNQLSTGVDACACTPAATGLAATSSGAINSLAFGGHQYLFGAVRTSGVVAVDITDPTLTSPPTKVWTQIFSNAPGSGGFGSISVGGVTPFVGTAGHPQVLAFAYGSKHVIVLNAQTLVSGTPGTDNPVDAEMDVPLKATLAVTFSGGGAFIGSAVPLGGSLLALATADGYMVFDASQVPAASSVVKVYPVDDPNEIIAENLGGDVVHKFLLGGNENGGAQLVDLSPGVTNGTSYYITPANFSMVFPSAPNTVDGNSVDQALQVGILTFEDTNDAEFVNMATITKTVSTTSGTLNSWAPASNGTAHVVFGTTTPPTISGSAVDSTSHFALFMAGFSNDIAVGLLQDPASVPAGSWQGLKDWSFYTITNSPSLSSYTSAADPHGDGVVFNLAKSTPYGYVLDGSDHGVVQIDLAGLLAITRAGTSGDAAHQPGTDPATVTNTATGGKVLHEFTF